MSVALRPGLVGLRDYLNPHDRALELSDACPACHRHVDHCTCPTKGPAVPLHAVPDPDHGICPDCEGSGEIHYNRSPGREPWNDDSQTCPRCLGDGWLGDVPVQEFEVGERVRTHGFTGTVVEYVPQLNADNLYRVLWDGAEADRDLYPAHGLQRVEQAA